MDSYETRCKKACKATTRLSLAGNRTRRVRRRTHVDAVIDRVETTGIPLVGELSGFPIKNVSFAKFEEKTPGMCRSFVVPSHGKYECLGSTDSRKSISPNENVSEQHAVESMAPGSSDEGAARPGRACVPARTRIDDTCEPITKQVKAKATMVVEGVVQRRSIAERWGKGVESERQSRNVRRPKGGAPASPVVPATAIAAAVMVVMAAAAVR